MIAFSKEGVEKTYFAEIRQKSDEGEKIKLSSIEKTTTEFLKSDLFQFLNGEKVEKEVI